MNIFEREQGYIMASEKGMKATEVSSHLVQTVMVFQALKAESY